MSTCIPVCSSIRLICRRAGSLPDGWRRDFAARSARRHSEGVDRMLVLIRGAGDLATGIALRLFRSHLRVAMTDLPQPTAIRRTVCFSQAILYGSYQVEDVTAERAETEADVRRIPCRRTDPVLADPKAVLPRVAAAGRGGRRDPLAKRISAPHHRRAACHRRRPRLLRGEGLPRGHRDHARPYPRPRRPLGRALSRTSNNPPASSAASPASGCCARRTTGSFPSARRYRRTRAGRRCGRRGERQADDLHDRGRHPRDAGRRDAGLEGMKSGDVDPRGAFPSTASSDRGHRHRRRRAAGDPPVSRAFFRMSRVKTHGRYNIE